MKPRNLSCLFVAVVVGPQAVRAAGLINVAGSDRGGTVIGPMNSSGSRSRPPVAIDGDVSEYGRNAGYMWAYLKTPLTVRLREPTSISAVEMLLLDTDRRDYGYVIETSLDGTRWQAAVDRSKAHDRSWQLHRFVRRVARMIRVRFTRTSLTSDSYHVVEVAAYDLPPGMTSTPLKQAWEASRAQRRRQGVELLGVDDAKELLADRALMGEARGLAEGRAILRDLDQDGDPDALIHRDGGAIVVALDDNDDLDWHDRKPDGRDDCLAVDLGADGLLDRSVDYTDTDGNGVADVMVQTYVSGSPWGTQAMALSVDLDQRGPKRLWNLTPTYGYSQGRCQWKCDFGGDGYFVLLTRDTRAGEWVGRFENPFCFYDPDEDGLAEETVRVSGRGRQLRSVRYGVNADNDRTEGEDYDYDFSVTALGSVAANTADLTRFTLRTGERTGEYLKWERTRPAVRGLPWQRALLVWDENDHNVAPRGARHERWEGVINASYRGLAPTRRFPQEGGPSCGTTNKRYELDADFSGKMRLYYWPADRRIHLFGAEDGRMTGDYDYDGRIDMTVEYRDTDRDGFFDRRDITTRSPRHTRTVTSPASPSQTMPLDYAEISSIWPKALADTLAAQKELLGALRAMTGLSHVPAGPLFFYERATPAQFGPARKMRQSQEARRYYQDLEVELHFAAATAAESRSPDLVRARRLADQGRLREAAAALRDEAKEQR